LQAGSRSLQSRVKSDGGELPTTHVRRSRARAAIRWYGKTFQKEKKFVHWPDAASKMATNVPRVFFGNERSPYDTTRTWR
jgi:hypothetical protein